MTYKRKFIVGYTDQYGDDCVVKRFGNLEAAEDWMDLRYLADPTINLRVWEEVTGCVDA